MGVIGTAGVVVATTVRATDTRTSQRIAAHETDTYSVRIAADDSYLIVRGDGSTDLDCWLYDSRGELVAVGNDSTDFCILLARRRGLHHLLITNLGDVYNEYVLSKE